MKVRRTRKPGSVRSARRKHRPSTKRPLPPVSATRALRESEQRLRAILETAVEGIITIDERGTVESINPAALKLFGHPATAVLGRNVNRLMPSPVREAHDGYLADYLHTGVKKVMGSGREVEGLRKNGEVFPLHLSVTEFETAAGRRFVGFLRDITETKRSNEALRLSERRFRSIYEHAATGIAIADSDGRFVQCNPAYCRITGYSEPELRTLSFPTLVHPDDRPYNLRLIRRLVDGVVPSIEMENRYLRKDGQPVWVHKIVSVLRDSRGHGSQLVALVTDISVRKKMEDALRQKEQDLSAFFAGSPIGLMWVSTGGTVLRANRAQLDMLGCAEADVLGRPVVEFDGGNDLAGLLSFVDQGGEKIHNQSAVLRCHRGGVRQVLIDVVAIRADRKLVRSDWFVRDISRRVDLEREVLSISERERRRFGQDLHDDLCQTLTGIAFRCETLAQRLTGLSRSRARDAEELAALVRRTNAHAREMARGLSPLPLGADGLATALKELASRTTRFFHVDCRLQCKTPVLIEDEATGIHLLRIAQEAVGNAIKHGQPRHIEIGLTKNDREIVLAIRDDGRGLPKHRKPTKGMGLRVMQYRAGVIGGSLLVQRQAGGGTVVVCTVKL
jgi:PAS domain S-box-containing protein